MSLYDVRKHIKSKDGLHSFDFLFSKYHHYKSENENLQKQLVLLSKKIKENNRQMELIIKMINHLIEL